MGFTKVRPGSQVVSTRVITSELFKGNHDMGLTQPPNSILEKAYLRIIEAPTLSTAGDIGCNVGTGSASNAGNRVNGGTDNILDGGTTLPAGVIFDLTSATGTTFDDGFAKATGDEASETASGISGADPVALFVRLSSSVAVTDPGVIEVSLSFRVFE